MLTIDEARKALGYPPLPNILGTKILVQPGLVTLSSIVQGNAASNVAPSQALFPIPLPIIRALLQPGTKPRATQRPDQGAKYRNDGEDNVDVHHVPL